MLQMCGWELAPIVWWIQLEESERAAWLQAFGGLAAILSTVAIYLLQRYEMRADETARKLRHAEIVAMTLQIRLEVAKTEIQQFHLFVKENSLGSAIKGAWESELGLSHLSELIRANELAVDLTRVAYAAYMGVVKAGLELELKVKSAVIAPNPSNSGTYATAFAHWEDHLAASELMKRAKELTNLIDQALEAVKARD